MNKAEYTDYEARYRMGMDGLSHFSSNSWVAACADCPNDVEYTDGVCYDAEPYYSWHACEICSSHLGGDREDCHAEYDGQLIHLRVCSDCVYYAEYGQLDDKTMAEVAANS